MSDAAHHHANMQLVTFNNQAASYLSHIVFKVSQASLVLLRFLPVNRRALLKGCSLGYSDLQVAEEMFQK